jgi:hypothetical protein
MKYQVGIDFGTSASKVCAHNTENDEFEFLNLGKDGYFLPSILQIKEDNTIVYGTDVDKQKSSYRFFKMAALKDPYFRGVAKETELETTYNYEELYKDTNFSKYNHRIQYHPEFLSSLYITHLLLKTESILTKKGQKSGLGGLFGRLTGTTDKPILHYTLGFPTEFNDREHLLRKRKMESMVYLAIELKKQYGTSFYDQTVADLFNASKAIFDRINSVENTKQVLKTLQDFGIFLYPEAAASLAFIRKNRSLSKGCYITMDIGGGTTDISFFYLNENYQIKYHTSEAIPIASNNVFAHYAGTNDYNQISSTIESCILGELDKDKFIAAQNFVKKQLDHAAMKLFVLRLKKHYDLEGIDIKQGYNKRTCFFYGGGSSMTGLTNGQLVLFTNNIINQRYDTITNKELLLHNQTLNIKIKNVDNVSQQDLSRLVVCLGLAATTKPPSDYFKFNNLQSTPSVNSTADDWLFVDQYISDSTFKKVLVPHPINEDRYIPIYHVADRKWKEYN